MFRFRRRWGTQCQQGIVHMRMAGLRRKILGGLATLVLRAHVPEIRSRQDRGAHFPPSPATQIIPGVRIEGRRKVSTKVPYTPYLVPKSVFHTLRRSSAVSPAFNWSKMASVAGLGPRDPRGSRFPRAARGPRALLADGGSGGSQDSAVVVHLARPSLFGSETGCTYRCRKIRKSIDSQARVK